MYNRTIRRIYSAVMPQPPAQLPVPHNPHGMQMTERPGCYCPSQSNLRMRARTHACAQAEAPSATGATLRAATRALPQKALSPGPWGLAPPALRSSMTDVNSRMKQNSQRGAGPLMNSMP